MHVINARDVNEALPRALAYLRDHGTLETTRNGPALVAPGPVATVYRDPRRRVLFDAERDANPFFHLFESLWILEGRNDVRFLSWFNSRIADYSDNGATFHAPYGHRMREGDAGDQIRKVCDILRENHGSRQAVLQIWDAHRDLGAKSKDIPCNDMVMLRVRKDESLFHKSKHALDITVCNRSNDAVWGAYGANAVQFSMLQEYIAMRVDVAVGRYTQMSNNLHVYLDNPYWQKWVEKHKAGVYVRGCEYDSMVAPGVDISPFSHEDPEHFDQDLAAFFDCADDSDNPQDFASVAGRTEFKTVFFRGVVVPMLKVFAFRSMPTSWHLDARCDWHHAASRWLERRRAAALAKQNENGI